MLILTRRGLYLKWRGRSGPMGSLGPWGLTRRQRALGRKGSSRQRVGGQPTSTPTSRRRPPSARKGYSEKSQRTINKQNQIVCFASDTFS